MKIPKTRYFALMLVILFAASIIAGCGGGGTTTGTTDAPDGTTTTAAADPDETTEPATGGLIADGDVTLLYWAALSANVAPTATSLSEVPMYQELERRTGVIIEFQHPPLGQENEQFNLMIAANELPDLIERDWLNFPGGPEKAVEDEIIIKINDIIDDYAINLKAYYAEYPEHEKQVITDNGTHYVFPFIRRDERLLTWNGPQMRADWLEDLDIEVPTTIAEWEDMLIAFRDEKGADAPFSYKGWLLGSSNSFLGAYGVGRSFFQEAGEVKFGPIEDGYKDFLTLFAHWYAEGLLDPDFASQDDAAYDAKVTSGRTGAMLDTAGSGMGKFISLMQDDPDFMLVGAPVPTLNKGETPMFGHKDFNYTPGGSVAITTMCEEIEIAAKWLDYAYGEEGHILFNFGIEGESFNWESDFPQYTEYIINNPDGLPMVQAMGRYMRSNYSGPMIQDGRYFDQYMQYPAQLEAVSEWLKHDDSRRIPPITATPDESQRLAAIMNEVNTFVEEFFVRFIMGQEDLNNFDSYVDQVKNMGIEEAISIRQAGLDRYNAR